jgi:hypothetical protein
MRTTKANEVTELATESATLADSSTEPDTEMDQYYHPETVKNYRKLLQAATKYQFDVVAVQYPVRPVAPLQELIEQVHQPRNSPIEVVVVDNSDVFHRALQTLPYDELFTDNFGGDFGHATREGNRLLSQNIEQAVLPLLPFAKGN